MNQATEVELKMFLRGSKVLYILLRRKVSVPDYFSAILGSCQWTADVNPVLSNQCYGTH
jgi:hypothetical protein